jgi:uncharacterized membrane protein SpoIIM required for sporulation
MSTQTSAPSRTRWTRLAELVASVGRGGVGALADDELLELPRLYREASGELLRLEASGADAGTAAELRALVARTHALLHAAERPAQGPVQRAVRFLWEDSPRAIRAEWKLALALALAFYGLAALAYGLVARDLELAFSLLAPEVVAAEIDQLRDVEQGEPFRGNFTFGLGESPRTAGLILAHNMGVSVLFFGAGLIPPLFAWMLGQNALMLGTYTAVAGHWDQAAEITSILWCHGTLELQAIVLAGVAGLVLVRAWIAPGPWSRSRAMALASRRAWALLAPVFPLLFMAGLIEGFISPHAPTAVRAGVALASAFGLVVWIGWGGRAPVREP